MSRNQIIAIAGAFALVATVAVPVSAGGGKAFKAPPAGLSDGEIRGCSTSPYASTGGTVVETGDTCITLHFVAGESITGGNVNWAIPTAITLPGTLVSEFDDAGGCTVDSATLVTTGAGLQARDVTCSNTQSFDVYVDVSSVTTPATYDLTGGYKTTAGGRTKTPTSNMFSFTYALTIQNPAPPCVPAGSGDVTILC